jgi:hypothetical protein
MISSFFHLSSLTFRNVFRGKVPRYLRSPLSCDIFLAIAHAQFGKIRFFPEPWSVYRAHGDGVFSGMSQTKGWMWNIDSFLACNRWLRFRYFATFSRSIWNYCDILLRDGKVEDGLTPEKRRQYEAIRRRYRWMEKAYLKLDCLLAKWIPGRGSKSSSVKLNLGSGRLRPLRAINVDKRADVDPDMVVDLERAPWPWPDNHAEEVYFERSLEHMGRDFDTFQGMMRELYRVSRPGARVVITAKHPWNNTFINDPTCVRPITPGMFALFDRQTPAGAVPEPVARRNGVDFEVVKRQVNLAEPYLSQFNSGQLSQAEAFRIADSWLNVCSDFQIELRVHKPARA